MRYHGQDPRWLRVKYQGECRKCGAECKVGTQAFYYPVGKRLLCEDCGNAAAAEFQGACDDEAFWNGGH
jgi:hypothetical protein